jgi:hypothetical protein
MKQITLSLFLLVLISCTVTEPKHYPRIVHFSTFDFTPFTEQGFLFTPEKYNFDYESIGLITCVIIPEEDFEVTKQSEQKERLDDIYADRPPNTMLFYSEEIEPDEVLKLFYDECVKMGADACINFNYQTRDMPSRNSAYRTIKYHIVSGFAIKRL